MFAEIQTQDAAVATTEEQFMIVQDLELVHVSGGGASAVLL